MTQIIHVMYIQISIGSKNRLVVCTPDFTIKENKQLIYFLRLSRSRTVLIC